MSAWPYSLPVPPNNKGDFPAIPLVRVKNVSGSAMAYGQACEPDFTTSTGGADTYVPGEETSMFFCVVDPTATGVKWAPMWIIVEEGGIADDGYGMAARYGIVDGLVIKSSGNVAEGDPLAVATSGNFAADAGAGLAAETRIYARALQAITGPSSATLAKILFNCNGWGQKVS